MKRTYWFRPWQFWKWFAAYYPASWQGWVVTIALASLLIGIFTAIDRTSHSASDTLITFSPFVIIILLIFDIVSFRTGKYPYWWKHWHNKEH